MFNVKRLQGVIISKQFCRQNEHETGNMVCTIRWMANAFNSATFNVLQQWIELNCKTKLTP